MVGLQHVCVRMYQLLPSYGQKHAETPRELLGAASYPLFAMSCQHTVYIAIISLQEATHAFPEAVTLITIVDNDK